MRTKEGNSLSKLARRVLASALSCAIALGPLVATPFTTAAAAPSPVPAAAKKNPCSLSGGIQHVIYLQFDNVHLTRDNPNVYSDLEQMPHLKDLTSITPY